VSGVEKLEPWLQTVPVVLTNEPTTPKALPESNDSVKAVRALEEQIRALRDTP
jgi:hypothetical protein